jgi:hypothetical protein
VPWPSKFHSCLVDIVAASIPHRVRGPVVRGCLGSPPIIPTKMRKQNRRHAKKKTWLALFIYFCLYFRHVMPLFCYLPFLYNLWLQTQLMCIADNVLK